MKVLLNNLRAYKPFEAHVDIDTGQDSKAKLEHIANYILMKDNSIIIDTIIVGRKRNDNGDFALVVDTKEEPCKKIGSMGRQHVIITNIVALTEENTTHKIEIRELKRKLTTKRNLL